jgi:hypothetical protein
MNVINLESGYDYNLTTQNNNLYIRITFANEDQLQIVLTSPITKEKLAAAFDNLSLILRK